MGDVIAEKASLPATVTQRQPKKQQPWAKWWSLLVFLLGGYSVFRYALSSSPFAASWPIIGQGETSSSGSCVQADPILPQSFDVSTLIPGNEGKIRSWLSGAVKIPTEIFDVMGPVGEDPRWDVFYDFAKCKYTVFIGVLV
jgi:Gly-Xaa carboxypeptidase